ncbi:hypothetical protein N657DRAFT_264705 [Parathielavia appendiculata]|uniref:Uncharacterized protein n=1 Tax=Parathielavia appendiculata TaxID=2587402 RepID=A0AAN6U3Y4_9PEZI|nr:hypothetical protein N657DRAFT_264705 [Parathielavia appendiculata]
MDAMIGDGRMLEGSCCSLEWDVYSSLLKHVVRTTVHAPCCETHSTCRAHTHAKAESLNATAFQPANHPRQAQPRGSHQPHRGSHGSWHDRPYGRSRVSF